MVELPPDSCILLPVIDCFALFQVPRCPWLDPDSLKSKFIAYSSEWHPDRFHTAPEPERITAQQRYTQLNAAYQCLREPKERLRHLLELELDAKLKDTQRVGADIMDLFMEVGELCRSIDAFLVEKSKVTAPLLKVQCFERGMQWTDTLNALRQKILVRHVELEGELAGLNSVWESAPAWGTETRRAALPLERLEQIYRDVSYVTRWKGQLEERLVQLSL